MALKIYNSLTNELEVFQPQEEGRVTMYVCGPTVYDYLHIGNARPLVIFDVIARYFREQNYDLYYVSNITDIDDKIINKATALEISEQEVTQKYTKAFLEDAQDLGNIGEIHRAFATDYMEQIIIFIEKLIDKKIAYVVDGDVYFSIDKAEKYYELSHQQMKNLDVGARITENHKKRNPQDFTLWKKTKIGIKWKAPWGEGRPGWHTECVAIIDSIFKGAIDIHGGGNDLKFPHHDNEIVQAKALDYPYLAKYWMHNGFVQIENEKMAKSTGNMVRLRDAMKQYGAMAVRLWLLMGHYRQPINFTDYALMQCKEIIEKMNETYSYVHVLLDLNKFNKKITLSSEKVIEHKSLFLQALEDDFNTANAITYVQEVLKLLNTHIRLGEKSFSVVAQYLQVLSWMCELLGLKLNSPIRVNATHEKAYNEWKKAKAAKDFTKADDIRELLANEGIYVR